MFVWLINVQIVPLNWLRSEQCKIFAIIMKKVYLVIDNQNAQVIDFSTVRILVMDNH